METINQLARYIFGNMNNIWKEIIIWLKINEDGLSLVLLITLIVWVIVVLSCGKKMRREE